MIDASTALAFSLFENKGVYALVLGSGISRSAQIPTGWEITLDLTRRLGLLEGETDQADWGAWHQKRFGKPPSYSDILDALAQTPTERRSILHSYIEPSQEDIENGLRAPTPAHKAIARLVRSGYIRVIITTNFDRLLETALRAEGVEPIVIRSDDDLSGAAPFTHSRCFILKVHGDYLDTRLRNTEEELSTYSKSQDALLDRIIDEHGLIVCGWSSDWDVALRAAITRTASRRYPLFWATRGEPSTTARDLVSLRDGKVIEISDADSFFSNLQARIEAQEARQRPNPLSVELLVATVKKQLAKPENRIALGDTVQQEIKRVQTALQGPAFDLNVRVDTEKFRERVTAYNALCEPLVHIAFTLGRWGEGTELRLAEDAVLAFSERSSNGPVVWLDLATYPALLITFAYCLGAAKSDRYDAMLRLLHLPIHQEHTTAANKAGIVFNLEVWSRQQKNFWGSFDGMERHYLPACDVLHPIFQDWLVDEFLSAKAFNLAWGWVEILFGLEFMVDRIEKESLRARLTEQAKSYVPIGRMTYDSEASRRFLDRLEQPAMRATLAAAGFANGDPEFLELIQRYMSEYVNEAGWR